MKPLSLGTAQWGSAYGVTNQVGRLSDEAVVDLVSAARELDVRALDTAPGYGDAQSRIAPWSSEFSITTKVIGGSDVAVPDQLSRSLVQLSTDSVERCLVHDWPSLSMTQQSDVVQGLVQARDRGMVRQVGISAYAADDLEAAAAFADVLQVAQVPANLLDQRLEGDPIIADLRARGWTIQARSVFLQGLLAEPSQAVASGYPSVVAVGEAAATLGVTPLELALAYVADCGWIDELVVGVTSADELHAIVGAMSALSAVQVSWRDLASDDLDVIDPRRWPAAGGAGS